jgi:hypothetical protein
MILDDWVEIKIAPVNVIYWQEKGYQVPKTGGRAGKNTGQLLRVKVSDLPPNSNIRVRCLCVGCEREYTNRYGRYNPACDKCRLKKRMTGNRYGEANLTGSEPKYQKRYDVVGRPLVTIPDDFVEWYKENKPTKMDIERKYVVSRPLVNRWIKDCDLQFVRNQPPEFIAYKNRVHFMSNKTYEENKHFLNPHNYPRTLNGVKGGYQLDHKISVKRGFMENIPPDELAKIENLCFIPWEDNRAKWWQ